MYSTRHIWTILVNKVYITEEVFESSSYRLRWKFSKSLYQGLVHLLRRAFEEFTTAGNKERVTWNKWMEPTS